MKKLPLLVVCALPLGLYNIVWADETATIPKAGFGEPARACIGKHFSGRKCGSCFEAVKALKEQADGRASELVDKRRRSRN